MDDDIFSWHFESNEYLMPASKMLNISWLDSLLHSVSQEILYRLESASKHSQSYIDLVSCKPFKKTSLPPLKYKVQNQMKPQISFLDLSNAEIAKRKEVKSKEIN